MVTHGGVCLIWKALMAIRTGRALYEGRHPHVRGYRGTFVCDGPFICKGLVPGLILVWCLFGSRWQALSSGPPVEMTALLVVYTKGEGVRAATRGEGIVNILASPPGGDGRRWAAFDMLSRRRASYILHVASE